MKCSNVTLALITQLINYADDRGWDLVRRIWQPAALHVLAQH